MGWATQYIKQLQEGKSVIFRPRGNSMQGRIESGQEVCVIPLKWRDGIIELPKVGEIVLCKVRGKEYLHLVKAIRRVETGEQYQIGNNKGFINGWTNLNSIYGRVLTIDGDYYKSLRRF